MKRAYGVQIAILIVPSTMNAPIILIDSNFAVKDEGKI